MELDQLRHSQKWNGVYRHIGFLISHHGVNKEYQPHGIWCWYLYFPVEQFEARLKKDIWLKDKKMKLSESSPERITHDYYGSYFGSLDIWHGGCTYYSKAGDKLNPIGKFGCDYNHYWDEESIHAYDLGWVFMDVKVAIRKLWKEYYLKIKKKCWYCGVFDTDGRFYNHSKFLCSGCVRKSYLGEKNYPDMAAA